MTSLSCIEALDTIARNVNRQILTKLRSQYADQTGYMRAETITDDLRVNNGYGRKTYFGKLKNGIELTELELSMVLDNGFSYFGGNSSINPDRTFCVTILID